MRNRLVLKISLPVLLLALVAAAPLPTPAEPAEPVGGRKYFFCAAFQVIKYGGMVTGQPGAVAVGAIGSGVACAFGW